MGIRFYKSIKLGKYLKINISNRGISATVGKKGATINLGSKGTYLNVSPTVAGISGTGLSYRQKLFDGYGGFFSKLINKIKGNDNDETVDNKENKDPSVVDEYNCEQVINQYLYRLTDDVLTKQEIVDRTNELEDNAELYKLANEGDEETIEALVGAFLNNLELGFDVKANYELEDQTLYVDLDLPEIEDFKVEYPALVNNEVVYKRKTTTKLKQEYKNTVISLGIYLASNFFNISGYIEEVIMSAFTSRRNSKGDLNDEYLYSVKFKRDIFEQTHFEELEDGYEFLLKFENRINLNDYTFKSIKPYEMPSIEKANALIDEAILGLKELGYKNKDINNIIPKLNECKFETSGEYLKEALRILANK